MKNVDKVKKGDWIFTCRMEPLQFSHIEAKNPADYNQDYLATLNEEDLSNFLNDDFVTIGGSNHSFKHCTCTKISEKYARWFLENEIYKLYDEFKDFGLYETEVKRRCAIAGIVYEGI